LPTSPLMRATGLALALTVFAGCTPSPVELRLVTPRLGVDQKIAQQLVRAFDNNPRVRLRLVPRSNDSMSSLDLLQAGAGELALVSNGEAFRDDIDTVMPLYPTVLHIAYRSDLQPVDSSELLMGTTIFAGPPGSPSRVMLQETASHLGISVDALHLVQTLTPRPDIVVLFAPVSPGLMDDFRDYRLFSIGTVDELGRGSAAESIGFLQPKFQPIVLPKNTYAEVLLEPIVTIAVDKLLVARSDVPATVVYDLILEVLRLKPALSATQPGLFHKLSGDFDAGNSTFVIHPGAQAYIDRDAPTAYERYSGVAEVAVTLLVSLFSGTYAAVRIYRIRRKNRIDTFYERAIAIRKAAGSNEEQTVRLKAIDEIRALQENAFDHLVDEKLAPDESFRIFITLCNDIIADLRG